MTDPKFEFADGEIIPVFGLDSIDFVITFADIYADAE